MPEDLTPIEQFALVLLRHSAFEEHGERRSWKGYDWEIMNRLWGKGFFSDPVGKASSVLLTESGRKKADMNAAPASRRQGGRP